MPKQENLKSSEIRLLNPNIPEYFKHNEIKNPEILHFWSDPNNESDPSSEYSLLGLTHVMNHHLGQKFNIWVKINCLDMSTGYWNPPTSRSA